MLEQQRRLREETTAALQRQQLMMQESIDQKTGLKDLVHELREALTKMSDQIKATNDTKTAAQPRGGGNDASTDQSHRQFFSNKT